MGAIIDSTNVLLHVYLVDHGKVIEIRRFSRVVSARSKLVLVVHVNVFCLRNHEGVSMSNARSCRELATLGPFFGASVDRDVVKKSFKNRRFVVTFASCFGAAVDLEVVKKSLKNRRFLLILPSCCEASVDRDVVKKSWKNRRFLVILRFCFEASVDPNVVKRTF